MTSLLTEKIALLLLSPNPLPKGEIPVWFDIQLNFLSSCFILSDLIFQKRIVVSDNQVKVISAKTMGVEPFDTILETINKSDEEKTFTKWLNYFSDIDYPEKQKTEYDLYNKVESYLIGQGFQEVKKEKWLFVFNNKTTNLSDKAKLVITETIAEIRNAISTKEFNDQVLLLSIFLSERFVDILKFYLSEEENKNLKDIFFQEAFIKAHKLVFDLSYLFSKAYSSESQHEK